MNRRAFRVLAGLVLMACCASRSEADVTLTRVTLTESAAGELLYQGKHTFTTAASPIAIPVDERTAVNGVQVRLTQVSNNQPVDAANPALRTTDEGGRRTVSVLVRPLGNEPNELQVDVVIPLPDAAAGRFTTRWLLNVGAASGLAQEFLVANGPSVAWVNGTTNPFFLRLKTADGQIQFEDPAFPRLNPNANRTRLQNLDVNVDSTTMFVQLDALLEGGTASPQNKAGLPRYVRLRNGATGRGARIALPARTELNILGPTADPQALNLSDKVNLPNVIPVGAPIGAVFPCPQCCC
jgi:hypothetical protein